MSVLLAVLLIPQTTEVTPLISPAAANSAEPNLVVGADGKLYLSWIESEKPTATLKFSVWQNDRWSKPRTIASGDNWFVNWADFPSLAVLKDGTMAAHWLQKSSSGTYSYDVMISLSNDGGQAWSKPMSPHQDGTPTEHGFVSMVPLDETRFGVVWLDGRAMTDDDADMSIRFTTLSREGKFGSEVVIDDRVCECCQTTAVLLPKKQLLVAYRDRSQDEVRDIAAAIVGESKASGKFVVNDDGWQIDGCPVNGPALDRRGATVVAAWPTRVNDKLIVRVRFSKDNGKTWGRAVQVNQTPTVGRVDVTLIDESRAAVSWVGGGPTWQIRSRIISDTGVRAEVQAISDTDQGRSSGFPRQVLLRDSLFFAWTDVASAKKVKTARLRIK